MGGSYTFLMFEERSNMTLAAILTASPVSNLRKEYQYHRSLYEAQPVITQRFLDQQAQGIAQAILADAHHVRFSLPDRVFPGGDAEALEVPAGQREQAAGPWFGFWTRNLRAEILQQFLNLERSPDQALSLCGSLMRFALAHAMIYQMLPDGRSVRYRLLSGDEIPSQPVEAPSPNSAISDGKDAVGVQPNYEAGRGELQVPYPSAALRFFLPQWVAFDEKDRLLTNTLEEAESHIRSMQTYLTILHHAEAIDPYFVADETYQRKRTGMLGQLVNQGRALGRYEVREIIKRIKRRAGEGSLNRGLNLRLPYFNEQTLTMNLYNMEVVPAGRVMFVPAFVVLAVRREYAKIIQDTRLNSPTRKHLLSLLAMLEKAFLTKKEYKHL
jgi:hypothetical protein